jgi:type 1 glutamine amidotransferase
VKKRMWALLGILLFGLLGSVDAGDKAAVKKRLLVITESKGFRHGCVTRKVQLAPDLTLQSLPQIPGLKIHVDKSKKDGKTSLRGEYNARLEGPTELQSGGKLAAKVEPCLVETIFMELARRHNFQVVCSQDSRAEITAENLKNFDAVWFYTTGELPLSDGQKADLLAFVKGGKGFGGSHSATDTFYKWPEYGDMIGAYFAGHPPGLQKIRVIVEDSKHPATRHLGKSFDYEDEIYQFRAPYSRDKLHVLMRVDMKATKNLWRKDGDNPLAWIREYGKGRVFYTALGHADRVWRDELFQEHVVGGLRYVFFLENADATPSGMK